MRDLMSSEARPSLVPMIAAVTATYAVGALDLDASGHSLSFSRSVIPMLVVGSRMVLTFLVGPVILAVVGRWLRGQGDAKGTLHAVVWSYLPLVVSACIYTPVGLMAVGLQFFALDRIAQIGTVEITESLVTTFAVLRAVDLAGKVWTVGLVIVTISEVHRFSIWRALVAVAVFYMPLYVLTLMSKW